MSSDDTQTTREEMFEVLLSLCEDAGASADYAKNLLEEIWTAASRSTPAALQERVTPENMHRLKQAYDAKRKMPIQLTTGDELPTREAFESWARGQGLSVQWSLTWGNYKYENTRYAWASWCASRSIPAARIKTLEDALEKIRRWDVPGEPGSVDERHAVRDIARAALGKPHDIC